jgi:fatty acid desaturase
MQRLPELGSLRAELRAAGVFEHRELRSWLKLGFLLSVVALCLVSINLFGWIAAIPAIPIAAVFATAAAMTAHEGSHKSFSASPGRNAFLVYLVFPLFAGLGSLYWRHKHDQLHHGHPNVEGVDPDIKPFPFVSSRGDHEKASPRLRWFQRNFQSWAFWPMSLLMATGMRRSSIVFLMQYPKKHGFKRTWFIELACMTGHYVGWILIPSLIWGPAIGVGVYMAIWALVGVCLALVFAPAHIGLPIMAEQNNDWLHQLETTRDLEMPKIVSFFFIGLDYQAEHHVFPKIPHQNLPKAAAITKAWCARHGITYLSVPYLYALVDSAKFMAHAWERESTDPAEVRFGLVGSERAA